MVNVGGFFCQTGIFRGVFSIYYLPEGSAKLRWAGLGSGDINDKYDNNRAAYCTFTDFFPKLEFPRGYLYIILISPKGTAKLRWRGQEKDYSFRLKR